MALLGALARLSRNPVAYGVAGFYVSFFRGTPLIVQMFLLYLALPPVGRNLQRATPGYPRASTRHSSWTPRPPASSRWASTTART